MIQSRLSRPNELGLRIDTPMREESRPTQGSTSSVSSLLSPPLEANSEGQTIRISYKMSHGSPTSGFTAVNGDAHRNTSFRPDESVQRPVNVTHFERKDAAIEQAGVPQQVHSWRPDERSATHSGDSGESPTNKRKRADSEKDAAPSSVPEDRPNATEIVASKRRNAAMDASATVSTTSTPHQTVAPVAFDHTRERVVPGIYDREPSPIFMKDRGAPPPPPRPEVAADLAKSLQRELASAQGQQRYVSPAGQRNSQQVSPEASDDRQHTVPVETSASPVDGSYDHQQSPPYESETGQNGDADDSSSKKRKRNFSNRTKTGCHTCRARKKKCDENKPICHNCQRGGFECGGYGPKPPGGSKVSAARPLTAIKPAYEPSHGPSQFSLGPYYDNRPRQPQPTYEQPNYAPPPPPPQRAASHGLPPVHHYNHPHVPRPVDFRPRDGYTMQYPEPPHHAERFPPHGLPQPPPPPEYGALPPYRVYPDPNHSSHHRTPSAPSAPPVLPRYGTLDQYHGPPGPPTTISSKDSGISSHSTSQRSRPGLVYRSGEKIDRSKMITGEPCLYFTDRALINERASCKEILERYNDADRTTSGVSIEHKGVIFSQLVNPKERNDYGHSWDGPIGSVGDRVVVQAPFSCEYGYNLNFGDETMIMRNCHFQDAATISIGSHVTVGPGCSFLTLVSPTSAGPQGLHSTGAIRIEDGCTIGGNVTILPFRTIGKGATVIAGSVVTKDVKPNSIVAGNPAKPLREVDEVVEKENAKALKEMQNGTWRRERYP